MVLRLQLKLRGMYAVDCGGALTPTTPLRVAEGLASLEDKKSGTTYGSVSDSIVIRLPPSSSSSPSALRLLSLLSLR